MILLKIAIFQVLKKKKKTQELVVMVSLLLTHLKIDSLHYTIINYSSQ
jgi:hypothetical protein